MCGCALSVMLLTLAVVLPTPHDYSGTFQGEYSARFTASELQVPAPELQSPGSALRVELLLCKQVGVVTSTHNQYMSTNVLRSTSDGRYHSHMHTQVSMLLHTRVHLFILSTKLYDLK